MNSRVYVDMVSWRLLKRDLFVLIVLTSKTGLISSWWMEHGGSGQESYSATSPMAPSPGRGYYSSNVG